MTPVEITVTCASADEARSIVARLVAARLVACGQFWPIASCYVWNGAVVDDDEHLLVLKSRAELFDRICVEVRALHSYELPAIVMLPIAAAGPGYLAWLADATSSPEPSGTAPSGAEPVGE